MTYVIRNLPIDLRDRIKRAGDAQGLSLKNTILLALKLYVDSYETEQNYKITINTK